MAQEQSESDLTQLSIENLMEQKVTSVSRTEQSFSDTAAATFVIPKTICGALGYQYRRGAAYGPWGAGGPDRLQGL
ncbi:MAG: hypothetical protein ACREU8_06830 [Gammaproteobacteria bacterium]